MLRIVARHADGWNVPFLAPEIFAARSATLDQWCEREQRDPAAILRTVNVGLAIGEDEAAVARQRGEPPPRVRPDDRVGAPRHPHRHAAELTERLRAYEAAGAQWVILALRALFDWAGLELFVRSVMPGFLA